jgi:hypothetical protein
VGTAPAARTRASSWSHPPQLASSCAAWLQPYRLRCGINLTVKFPSAWEQSARSPAHLLTLTHTRARPRRSREHAGPDMMGIALKEPKGNCDGSNPLTKGPKLFSCKPGHGMFVSPDEVGVHPVPPPHSLPCQHPFHRALLVCSASHTLWRNLRHPLRQSAVLYPTHSLGARCTNVCLRGRIRCVLHEAFVWCLGFCLFCVGMNNHHHDLCSPGQRCVNRAQPVVMLLDHWNAAMAEQYERIMKEKSSERKSKTMSVVVDAEGDKSATTASSPPSSSPPSDDSKPSKKKVTVSPKDATNARLARLAKIRESGDPTVQLRRPKTSSVKHKASPSAASPKLKSAMIATPGSKGSTPKSSPASARSTPKSSPAGAMPSKLSGSAKTTPGSKRTTPKASPAGGVVKASGKGSARTGRAKSDGAVAVTVAAATKTNGSKASPKTGRSHPASRSSAPGKAIDDPLLLPSGPARPHPFLDADEIERRRAEQHQVAQPALTPCGAASSDSSMCLFVCFA